MKEKQIWSAHPSTHSFVHCCVLQTCSLYHLSFLFMYLFVYSLMCMFFHCFCHIFSPIFCLSLLVISFFVPSLSVCHSFFPSFLSIFLPPPPSPAFLSCFVLFCFCVSSLSSIFRFFLSYLLSFFLSFLFSFSSFLSFFLSLFPLSCLGFFYCCLSMLPWWQIAYLSFTRDQVCCKDTVVFE